MLGICNFEFAIGFRGQDFGLGTHLFGQIVRVLARLLIEMQTACIFM